ncbi:MAG: hypothetical protein LQ340_006351 [Diploschistes diacapsis]|nr:MAG: hypothetical protein LQ340_006351 [Diploschistes diacapsis]
MEEKDLPQFPANLYVGEQDIILAKVNDRLSQCAFDFVAKYQFPIPLEQDKRPVETPADREWTEWIRKQKSYASSPSFRSLGTICSLRNELAYHKAKQTAEAICYAKVKERYAKMVDALTSLEGALKKMSIARAWTESIHNRAALLRNGQLGKCQPTTAADEL